jgi:membrane-bound lytic murein transglycosylase MltF
MNLGIHLSKQYKDDLPALLKRSHIRVLTVYNKTDFFLSNGRCFGFEYSLLKDYEKFLNKARAKDELKIILEFIPVRRDRLVSGLINGYGDIAAGGLTITKSRQTTISFTDPYWTGIDEIVVTHKSLKPLTKLEDLAGQSVYVRKSSSYYESLLAFNKELIKEGKNPVKIIKADENLETEDILELVNSGTLKITVCNSHKAKLWAEIFNNLVIYQGLRLRSGAKLAWIVRHNNPRLKASLNQFIKSHKKGTLKGNIYFKRYYKETKWIKNPYLNKGAKKLNVLKHIFLKYANQYGFDWRLLAAMAYQESGLKHNKKSEAGAIGIMQIRLDTAKGMGIKNPYNLEENIHAAAKYLAFLRKKYFSTAKISPRNQIRFALAAYNAGPARINKARRLAKEFGFDPNQWFRNVEMVVLQLIGQQPVQYVSNVNKYYIIYYFVSNRLGSQNKKSIKNKN